jgi:hypothetical protein
MKELIEDTLLRAEDILLGSLGYGEDAKLTALYHVGSALHGSVTFSDGLQDLFQLDDELTELERWAVNHLLIREEVAA